MKSLNINQMNGSYFYNTFIVGMGVAIRCSHFSFLSLNRFGFAIYQFYGPNNG
jgi:hypothetical protein